MAEPDAYLADRVRKADADRHLSVLYAPADKRQALLALYAFDAEISRVRDLVSDPMPGEIRLQWWRDIVGTGEPAAAAGHPVAVALAGAIAAHRLPVNAFIAYLDAKTFDLYDDPMPSLVDLEGYCGETNSAILQLAALVLDPAEAQRHATLAGHAGCALEIARLIRLMPLHRSRGQCYVPADVLAATGLDREGYLAGQDESTMTAVVEAMASLARDHLAAFRRGAGSLAEGLRPAYLPLATLEARLARVEPRSAWRIPASDISPAGRHWRIFRRAWRGWPPL